MKATVLPAAERTANPWKNGGGVTREVRIYPPGSAFEDFDWRVSLAEVSADGPFSRFPEVDRTLAVLTGTLRLGIAGVPEVVLTPASLPIAFPGDVEAYGEVLGGPVADLNVMTRRGRFTARVAMMEVAASHELPASNAAVVLILATRAALQVRGPSEIHHLAPGDALMLEGPTPPLALSGASGSRLHLVTLERV